LNRLALPFGIEDFRFVRGTAALWLATERPIR
jgi:hypothetical protein